MLQDQEQKMNRIAIIGAGITGLSVAFSHLPHSNITMFDKSRKPGGRVSTRTSRQQPGYVFDHGAPFVYVKGQFLNLLQKLNAINQVKIKKADFKNKQKPIINEKTWLGGNPSIQTIPIKLVQELKNRHKIKIEYDTRINVIQDSKQKGKFILSSQQNKQYGPYDQVYVCIPYPQCISLKQNFVKFSKQFQQNKNYLCSWTIMAAFNKDSIVSTKLKQYDVCTNIGNNIQSMVNQRTKGNTSDDDLWVIHMEQKWSQQNINLKPENVEQQLKKKLQELFGKDIQCKFIKAHRWLYSKPQNTPTEPIIGQNIIFGADWVNKITNIQQCWQLGPLLYKLMNQNKSNL